MSERLWSARGMLLVGAKPNYSEKLPEPRCLPQISHGRLWDNLDLRGKRLGTKCPSYGTACCNFFPPQNYLVQKYKSKDSLSLNRLWA